MCVTMFMGRLQTWTDTCQTLSEKVNNKGAHQRRGPCGRPRGSGAVTWPMHEYHMSGVTRSMHCKHLIDGWVVPLSGGGGSRVLSKQQWWQWRQCHSDMPLCYTRRAWKQTTPALTAQTTTPITDWHDLKWHVGKTPRWMFTERSDKDVTKRVNPKFEKSCVCTRHSSRSHRK